MVFPSPVFIFVFLPVLLALYFTMPKSFRNGILLFSSLVFYSWGEPVYIFVMLFSIFVNWVFGLVVADGKNRKAYLVLSVVFNLGMLIFFKYLGFLIENLNSLMAIDLKIRLFEMPIGISFYTFQAMSYVIDVYQRTVQPQRSVGKLALYISLFPQLVAGPIVRYVDVAQQIDDRTITLSSFRMGVERFIIGLAKKVLIANVAAAYADRIFESPVTELATGTAWLGIFAYTIQIFFDFSGYSDMAIGLGKMFGFSFLENFNLPYSARSIKDFWRRWHISLSTWFRDYLYIPLGGNRCSVFRSYANLFIVFGLCGIWHGASWSFLVWGLFHGFFLVLERTIFGGWLDKTHHIIQRFYTLLVVMVGWVFFRAETIGDALKYISKMFSVSFFDHSLLNRALLWDLLQFENLLFLLLALVWSLGIFQTQRNVNLKCDGQSNLLTLESSLFRSSLVGIGLCGVFLFCLFKVVTETYNPFIYFRF